VRAPQKKQTQISTIRAYIEPYDGDHDIEVSIKDGKDEILFATLDIRPASWIYLEYDTGDLIINHSPKMAGHKWDHIIEEILNNG
jgi:hypothetical protein